MRTKLLRKRTDPCATESIIIFLNHLNSWWWFFCIRLCPQFLRWPFRSYRSQKMATLAESATIYSLPRSRNLRQKWHRCRHPTTKIICRCIAVRFRSSGSYNRWRPGGNTSYRAGPMGHDRRQSSRGGWMVGDWTRLVRQYVPINDFKNYIVCSF